MSYFFYRGNTLSSRYDFNRDYSLFAILSEIEILLSHSRQFPHSRRVREVRLRIHRRRQDALRRIRGRREREKGGKRGREHVAQLRQVIFLIAGRLSKASWKLSSRSTRTFARWKILQLATITSAHHWGIMVPQAVRMSVTKSAP